MWRNILHLTRLPGNRSVRWMDIKRASQEFVSQVKMSGVHWETGHPACYRSKVQEHPWCSGEAREHMPLTSRPEWSRVVCLHQPCSHCTWQRYCRQCQPIWRQEYTPKPGLSLSPRQARGIHKNKRGLCPWTPLCRWLGTDCHCRWSWGDARDCRSFPCCSNSFWT